MTAEVRSLRVLFCPTHYLFDNAREGSELSWAYNIADRIACQFPASVVVTGRSAVGPKPYRIVELTPTESRVNFGLAYAFAFNARYSLAALRALRRERFDVLHHVLPFAIGKTHNIAALRNRHLTPYVIGPVQPPVARDPDIDPTDLRSFRGGAGGRSVTRGIGSLASDVVAPVAFSRLSRRTLAHAAAVVAVTEEAKDLLVRNGAPGERIVVIPPGIDTQRFHDAEVAGARSPTIEILCVSRLLKRKNIDVIVRAFAAASGDAPDARLRVVGDGPERDALTRLAGLLGVSEKVTFAGFVPNAAVHEEYQRADIFVNASTAEGFATTCLEALASGLPVISTRVGGFRDAVDDGQNGYLLAAADAGELAATLARLLADKPLLAILSGRAREAAERRFDWEGAIIPAYRELYERVKNERQYREARAVVA